MEWKGGGELTWRFESRLIIVGIREEQGEFLTPLLGT
jgi:hypothetical protein